MITQKKHDEILKKLKKASVDHVSDKDAAEFKKFIECFYPPSAADDLLERDTDELCSIAKYLWKAGNKRVAGEAYVEVINPSKKDGLQMDHTVIVIVNDDMPFLVDSISGGLTNTLRSRLHMMHHPITDLVRSDKGVRQEIIGVPIVGKKPAKGVSRESYMYIEIDAHSDKEALEILHTAVTNILKDVRAAVLDWRAMTAKIDETVASLTVNPSPLGEESSEEAIKLLRWLSADHFTFLGFREYRFDGSPDKVDFTKVKGSGLGILRDENRYVFKNQKGMAAISQEITAFLKTPNPIIITKANVKSTVHRTSHMDYIGVKTFNENGDVVGERRFVGLFTSLSYSRSVQEIPIVGKKISTIQDMALFDKRSHAGKALTHILETFPRDETFQVDTNSLFKTAMGILQLTERPRTEAFIRPDPFGRYVSALVYVPRENYHSGLREAVAAILCDAYDGEVSVYYALLGEESLARWHFIIRTKPGESKKVDVDEVNAKIADAARGWIDRLQAQLVIRFGEEQGNLLNRLYKDRFSMGYREAFEPAQAAFDIMKLESLTEEMCIGFDFYHHLADGDNHWRLKIHHASRMVPLSDCLPMLENLGFKVIGEHSYEMVDRSTACIHDFTLSREEGIDYPLETMTPLIETLLEQVWLGKTEDDDFNILAIKSAMTWDEIVILRAYGKYLRQLGLGYTPDYIANCLVQHSSLAVMLIEIFKLQFDPASGGDRDKKAKAIADEYISMLTDVSSLDEDRILRAYMSVLSATQRTNFFQDGVINSMDERALAFKIKSRDVEEAPLPRPFAEIWVYSPRVEGVHLRGGPIARGGLRWSDRREDFRTEVLGLVKAQQVKNTVIVPQGSKGGFYAKNLPGMDNREAFMAEGIASYRSFISSLLSLTDNIVGGKIVPPKQVYRRDGDDPYLVVAADKGTATFSDIANSISEANGFWLGDAFASGGSKGYDHKGMGITAKGGWVSVQRLFRERGINVQEDPIEIIGIGDMSGDVFGNGMLLSKAIKLKAAFNHMHIFIDPNPNGGDKNWAERNRMFKMPRSSWSDYNAKLISKGGGIFSRADKSIPLSDEVRAWLGVSDTKMAPNDLIHTILKSEADLLWFGGIGTYIRASDESDAEVGDRANNAIRVTPDQLKVKVIGEGANLGMTHKARIEFSKLGGRLNADFIDNSAGVDCSDKEVNIKILLADVLEHEKLTSDQRDGLLVEMTDEVGEIVLMDNYLQTQAISLAEATAAEHRDSHAGLMRTLEREGLLNREIEFLPSDEKLMEMASNGRGLSRPEIATLMSYAKMSLYDVLLDGDVVNDKMFRPELERTFPSNLRERFPDEIGRHRLKKELIATVLCNEVVNLAGLTFVYDVKEETGLAVEDIVAAFIIVREVYGLAELWEQVNAMDYKAESNVQYELHIELANFIRHQSLWLLRNVPQPFDLSGVIKRFSKSVHDLLENSENLMSKPARKAAAKKMVALRKKNVPENIARKIAGIDAFRQVPDIIAVAEQTRREVGNVASVYFGLGHGLGFDWLHGASRQINVDDRWDILALRSVREDIADQQRELTKSVLESAGQKTPTEAYDAWVEAEKTKFIRADRLISDLKSSGAISLSKISFAARHMRSILK